MHLPHRAPLYAVRQRVQHLWHGSGRDHFSIKLILHVIPNPGPLARQPHFFPRLPVASYGLDDLDRFLPPCSLKNPPPQRPSLPQSRCQPISAPITECIKGYLGPENYIKILIEEQIQCSFPPLWICRLDLDLFFLFLQHKTLRKVCDTFFHFFSPSFLVSSSFLIFPYHRKCPKKIGVPFTFYTSKKSSLI